MHLTPEDDALVQGLLDRSLESAEREAAERLVQTNGDAQRRSTRSLRRSASSHSS